MPQWINFHYAIPNTYSPRYLVLLEVRAHSPAFVIGQSVPVLLEEGVDSGDSPVPRVLQVLQSEAPVLSIGLLPLQPVLRPHPLAVNELALPWLYVAAVDRPVIVVMTNEQPVIVVI